MSWEMFINKEEHRERSHLLEDFTVRSLFEALHEIKGIF